MEGINMYGDVFMECGHTALAKDGEGNPVCPICIGINPGARIVKKDKPDLTGRKAICSYCKRLADSRYTLPFFEYRPDIEYDQYYDGCRGWD
jgi:hypothetical protein